MSSRRHHLIRAPTIALSLLVLASQTSVAAQAPARMADAIQQLRAGDAFRALLTLNEVVAQNPNDGGLVARAHALRAMVYLAQEQPERARASAAQAIKADPSFVPSADELNPATMALFESTRVAVPANPEAAGQAAEQAGQFQQAFLSYLSAYQALPNPAPRDDDRRLRERIIRVAQKLGTPPIIPPEAQDHVRKADQLLEAEAVLGGTAGTSTQSAASELSQAIRIAPWWPEATFKLAGVLQKLQRVDDALVNLNLYKLADPQGYAAVTAAKAPAPVAAPAAAPRPAAVAPVVKTGTGTIYIYRTSNFFGGSARGKVDCDGYRMAELQNGRVVTFTAPAGKHLVKIHHDSFEVAVEPGGTYYFRSSIGASSLNSRVVTPDEGVAEIKQKNLKANDTNRVTTTQCTAPAAAPVTKR
jgi:tetratricopeptide (TPR) repeat protein